MRSSFDIGARIALVVVILVVGVSGMILVPAPLHQSEALAYNRIDHSDYPVVDIKGNVRHMSDGLRCDVFLSCGDSHGLVVVVVVAAVVAAAVVMWYVVFRKIQCQLN